MEVVGKKSVAVMISGRGSNMAALVKACQSPDYPARIDLVISDHADAVGLAFAKSHNIRTAAFERKNFDCKGDHEAAMMAALEDASPDIVCLAGFMRVLSGKFIARFEGRIVNIHPSLLPKYKGLNTHQRALEAGETRHGCTVHHVTEGLDDGPNIAQAVIDVLAGDTADSLAERLIVVEHQLYPYALKLLIDGTAEASTQQWNDVEVYSSPCSMPDIL